MADTGFYQVSHYQGKSHWGDEIFPGNCEIYSSACAGHCSVIEMRFLL